ncbi:unnamed protein product [Brassica rapa subsp. trilocularis]
MNGQNVSEMTWECHAKYYVVSRLERGLYDWSKNQNELNSR